MKIELVQALETLSEKNEQCKLKNKWRSFAKHSNSWPFHMFFNEFYSNETSTEWLGLARGLVTVTVTATTFYMIFAKKMNKLKKKIEFIWTYMVVNVMVTARLQWDPKLKTCLQVFSIWNRSHIYALPADCWSTYQIWHGIIVVNCN